MTNIYIFGAPFTFRIQYTQTQCKEGAKDVNGHLGLVLVNAQNLLKSKKA